MAAGDVARYRQLKWLRAGCFSARVVALEEVAERVRCFSIASLRCRAPVQSWVGQANANGASSQEREESLQVGQSARRRGAVRIAVRSHMWRRRPVPVDVGVCSQHKRGRNSLLAIENQSKEGGTQQRQGSAGETDHLMLSEKQRGVFR